MVSEQIRTYKRDESVVFWKTKEDYGGLSNMAAGYPIYVNGIYMRNIEILYQACRYPHRPDIQQLIIAQKSPITAKMKSKHFYSETRPQWDIVRVKVMRWCLRVKLIQNWDKFGSVLLSTGDKAIVEESRRDSFWGAIPIDNNILQGTNALGRLIMELRELYISSLDKTIIKVEPLDLGMFFLDGQPIKSIAADDVRCLQQTNNKNESSSEKELLSEVHEIKLF